MCGQLVDLILLHQKQRLLEFLELVEAEALVVVYVREGTEQLVHGLDVGAFHQNLEVVAAFALVQDDGGLHVHARHNVDVGALVVEKDQDFVGLLVVLLQVVCYPRRQDGVPLGPLLHELLQDLRLVLGAVAGLDPLGVTLQERLYRQGAGEEAEHEQPVHRVWAVVGLSAEPLEEPVQLLLLQQVYVAEVVYVRHVVEDLREPVLVEEVVLKEVAQRRASAAGIHDVRAQAKAAGPV